MPDRGANRGPKQMEEEATMRNTGETREINHSGGK